MVNYIKGDILDNYLEIFNTLKVIPVNCKGVMGAGLALQFKNKYPKIFRMYHHNCKNLRLFIGCVNYIHASDGSWFCLFPTKVHWKDKSKYDWIEQGLHYMKIRKVPVTSIAFPKIGCGLGELDWNKVKKSIIDILGEEFDLYLYE